MWEVEATGEVEATCDATEVTRAREWWDERHGDPRASGSLDRNDRDEEDEWWYGRRKTRPRW